MHILIQMLLAHVLFIHACLYVLEIELGYMVGTFGYPKTTRPSPPLLGHTLSAFEIESKFCVL